MSRILSHELPDDAAPTRGEAGTVEWTCDPWRCVCGPYMAAMGTCISPRLSFSMRNSDMVCSRFRNARERIRERGSCRDSAVLRARTRGAERSRAGC